MGFCFDLLLYHNMTIISWPFSWPWFHDHDFITLISWPWFHDLDFMTMISSWPWFHNHDFMTIMISGSWFQDHDFMTIISWPWFHSPWPQWATYCCKMKSSSWNQGPDWLMVLLLTCSYIGKDTEKSLALYMSTWHHHGIKPLDKKSQLIWEAVLWGQGCCVGKTGWKSWDVRCISDLRRHLLL